MKDEFPAPECRAMISRLSPQLREVLRHIANGKANKEIAHEMQLSENTVRVYTERVYSVTRVNCRAKAARVACAGGLV